MRLSQHEGCAGNNTATAVFITCWNMLLSNVLLISATMYVFSPLQRVLGELRSYACCLAYRLSDVERESHLKLYNQAMIEMQVCWRETAQVLAEREAFAQNETMEMIERSRRVWILTFVLSVFLTVWILVMSALVHWLARVRFICNLAVQVF